MVKKSCRYVKILAKQVICLFYISFYNSSLNLDDPRLFINIGKNIAKILYIKKNWNTGNHFGNTLISLYKRSAAAPFFPHPRDVSLPPPGGRSASQTETANSCQNWMIFFLREQLKPWCLTHTQLLKRT